MKFCVYLTIYSGNKLPPFYIGSTSLNRINKGYLGSVESKKYMAIWKTEIKNNRNLFKIKVISVYNTREEAAKREYQIQKSLNVINNQMYINQFISSQDYIVSQETKSKISNSMIGNKNNLNKKHTQRTKEKIRDSHIGRPKSESHKRKLKESHRGRTGKINSIEHRMKISQSLTGRKLSEEHKKKLSETRKNKKYMRNVGNV